MKRMILGVVAALTVFAAGVGAQEQFNGGRGSFPGCPSCGVWSYVDFPSAEQTVSAKDFVIEGWGFECVAGAAIERVDLWYQDYAGDWWPLKQPDGAMAAHAVYRPDVEQHFRRVCPNAGTDTGWRLTVKNPPPFGLRRVRVMVWYGPYYEAHYRTYLIVP
jgi:hypothetical protein